ILLSFLRLMERSPEVLAAVRTRIEHLLVDEFQDVNLVQYRLVKLMASGSGLFVIGDPDQSIYGFRGASPEYFGQLEQDYPTTRTLHLGSNYRSHPVVVAAAEGVMGRLAEGEGGGAGPARTDARGGAMQAARVAGPEEAGEAARVRLVATPSEMAEGIAVVREISRLVGGADMMQTDAHSGRPDNARTQYGFADVAVLFRTGRQAEALEECFLTEGIPYRLVGQRGFLEKRGTRDAVAFFRFAAEPGRGLRILEALRVGPFHPGKAAVAKIASHLAFADGSVEMESLLGELSAGAEEKVRALWAAAAHYRQLTFEAGPFEVLERWREEFGDSVGADEAFDRLLSVAEHTATMAELLDLLLLGQEADVEQTGRRGPAADAVRLMTMHAAKGLEFPVVLVTGVEDGLIPLRDEGRACDEAEERRLFYVALTRAREEVVLLRAARRMRYAKRVQAEVSPFVADIPAALIAVEDVDRPRREPDPQLSLF
ncbi:MAG: ATP-dependent helicase, partial [Gemmatimonadota bacterium]